MESSALIAEWVVTCPEGGTVLLDPRGVEAGQVLSSSQSILVLGYHSHIDQGGSSQDSFTW
jgi:hypothetical protein